MDACGKRVEEVLEDQGWSATLGGRLYFHSSNTLRHLYRFDPATGVWETLPPVTDRRFFHLLADGDRLLAVGGIEPQEEREDGATPPTKVVTSIEAFDASTCSWRKVGSIPPGPPYRVAAILGRSLYLFGGAGDDREPGRGVSVVSLTDGKHESRKPMPKLRDRVREAVVVGERIYLLGDSNTVHVYDPQNDAWSRGANSGGHGTAADHLFVAHDGRIFSFPHTWGPIEVAAYDVASNAWADLDPLPGLSDREGDHVFAAEVVGGALHVAARRGRSRYRKTVVYRLDGPSGRWVEVP